MDSKFDIVFNGRFGQGLDRDSAIRQFAEKFNLDEEKAGAMLPATGSSTLKREVDEQTAVKYRQTLESVGVMVDLRPSDTGATVAPPAGAGTAPDPRNSTGETVAASAAGGNEDIDGQQFNPYARAVPRAQQGAVAMDTGGGAGDDSGQEAVIVSQRVFEGAVGVPAGRGIKWITEGYGNHVHRDLGAWVGAALVFFVLSIVLSFIPFIGSIALMLISPVVMAGFMIGAREQKSGGSFTISHIFSGFDAPGQLMLLALFYFLGMMIVALLTLSIFGMSMLTALDTESGAPPNPAVLLLPVLVMLALMLPILMAYWFAPALIALDGLSAFEAMKQSFLGCLKNIVPMLLYGLAGLVLAVIAAIPLFLGYILLVPVIIASIYVAYSDIFPGSEEATEPDTPA